MLTIKKSQSFCFVYKNIHFVFCLFLIILLLFGRIYNLFGLVFSLFFVFTLCIIFVTDKSLRKSAWRIDLNRQKNSIIFHMLKGDKIKKYDVSELCEFIINGHWYFKVGKNKIIWLSPNLKKNDQVLFLNSIYRLTKIKFGLLSYLDRNLTSLKKQLNQERN